MPDGKTISFTDGNQGPQQFIAGTHFGDFVVWSRRGGNDVPAYQLACVVDDAAMQITEVVRGADLLVSTARQLLLYEALGLKPPAFYHCPLFCDETGERLAKRHDALSLRTLARRRENAGIAPPGRPFDPGGPPKFPQKLLVNYFTIRHSLRPFRPAIRIAPMGNPCGLKGLVYVKRFGIIILVCACFAAIFAVNLKAQPATAPGGGAVVVPASPPAPAVGTTEEKVPSAAPEIFNVLGLPITNSMICTWIVAALIIDHRPRDDVEKNPGNSIPGMQNMMEALVEGWEKLIGDILDKRVAGWVFPFATTYFIFIVISNLVDLVPGVGSIGS